MTTKTDIPDYMNMDFTKEEHEQALAAYDAYKDSVYLASRVWLATSKPNTLAFDTYDAACDAAHANLVREIARIKPVKLQ